MIFGTPISWFIYEVLAIVLFVACLVHATRRVDPTRHVLTLAGFVLYAGIFENIGVWSGSYDYNLNRLLMAGTVPLSILLVEAVIFYAATWLAEHLNLPWWAGAVVVGFFGSYQDLTIDPSNVFDIHTLDGVASGQWNWAMNYDGGIFGIPFFNFSGWMTMMFYYALMIALVRRIAARRDTPKLAAAAPLLAIVPSLLLLVTINQFLLFAWPLVPRGQMVPELIMLCLNYGVALVLLVRFARLTRPLDLRRDAVVFAVPVVLHLWDIGVAFALGIEQAYVPSVLFGAIHIALLALVVVRGRRTARAMGQDAARRELVA